MKENKSSFIGFPSRAQVKTLVRAVPLSPLASGEISGHKESAFYLKECGAEEYFSAATIYALVDMKRLAAWILLANLTRAYSVGEEPRPAWMLFALPKIAPRQAAELQPNRDE